MSQKSGRNGPCPCGSGKKMKKCCGFKEQERKQQRASFRGFMPSALGNVSSADTLSKKMFKVLDGPKKEALNMGKILQEDQVLQEESQTEEKTSCEKDESLV